MAKKATQINRDFNLDDFIAAGHRVTSPAGTQAQEAQPTPERSTLRAMGDTAIHFGRGAVSGVRMMTDLAGADNQVSAGLRSADQAMSELLSATAKEDQRRIAEIMQEAEGKGWGEQIVAGLKAAGVAPGALMARAAGSTLPTLAVAAIPGAGPAAAATRMVAAGAIGAGQGAGNIKGQIYETTKAELLKDGKTPEEAEARAVEAQSFGGPNSGQIALGGAGGFLAASTGAERAVHALRNGVTKTPAGRVGRVLQGGITEAVPEALQGGQEKFASNAALNNEGFRVDPWSGVLTQATMEGAAGFGMGAATGLPAPRVHADAIRAADKVPESGPLSRAANAGVEARAQAVEATGIDPTQPPEEPDQQPEPVDDPMVDRIKALPAKARTEALRAYAVLNRDGLAKGVVQYNRKLLDRLLAENDVADKAEPEPSGPLLLGYDQTPTGVMLAGPDGVRPEGRADVVNREQELTRQRDLGLTPDVLRAPRSEVADATPQEVGPPMGGDVAPAEVGGVEAATPQESAPQKMGAFSGADEATAYISAQRRSGGSRFQALPLPMDDGSFGVATAESPEFGRAQEFRVKQERQAAGILDGDTLNKLGQPFKTRASAVLAAKKAGGEAVPVTGGFVVRKPTPQTEPPTNAIDQSPAPAVAPVEPSASAPMVDSAAAPAVGAEPEPVDALTKPQDSDVTNPEGSPTAKAEAAPDKASQAVPVSTAADADVPGAGPSPLETAGVATTKDQNENTPASIDRSKSDILDMGGNQETLQQPESDRVRAVRSAGDQGLSAVDGQLRAVPDGRGRAPQPGPHAGSDRGGERLRARQRQVGNDGRAVPESNQQSPPDFSGENSSSKGLGDGAEAESSNPVRAPEKRLDSRTGPDRAAASASPESAGGLDQSPASVPPDKAELNAPSGFKYAPPRSIETPAQGVLAGAEEARDLAFRRAKLIRQQVKNGRHDLRVELIKADSAHKEAVRRVEHAKDQIEKDANKVGLTTIKATPTLEAGATPPASAAPAPTADAVSQLKPEPLQEEESIVVKAGKGLIKGKYLVDVDGDGAPGGPWDTPEQARRAGEEWKQKTIDSAKATDQERARWDAIAEKFKAGENVTTAEIESLGLKAGASDVRWFFPIAARLFNITSRDIRPIVKGFIRESVTDMGARREFLPTRKALESVAADVIAERKPAAPARKRPPAAEKAHQARMAKLKEYFSPGNIVKAYAGHDRVLHFVEKDSRGTWSVQVEAVRKDGDGWVPVGKSEPQRWHSTEPSAAELKNGPIARKGDSAQGDLYAAQGADYTDTHGHPKGSQKSPKGGRATPASADGVRRDSGAVSRNPRITGLGIAADINRAGSAALVGRTVQSPADLAELAQVYRDPRYETFRVFLTKDGVIVHATGVSARLPGQAPMVPKGMATEDYFQFFREQMRQTGADGYYVLHNHPSGDPTPSSPDVALTRELAAQVPGMLGHVVINSKRFAVIQPNGKQEVVERDFGPETLLAASKPSPLLGIAIERPSTLVALGKSLQKPGWLTLIGVDSNQAVRVVADAPASNLSRSPSVLAGMVRRLMRQSGARSVHLVGTDADVATSAVQKALQLGILKDAIGESGQTQAERGNGGNTDGFRNTEGGLVAEASKVSEADGPYQVERKGLAQSLADGVNNVRSLHLPAGYIVNDLFQAKGKLHWWHKTVGTQYNLAQRSPEFKPVFDTAQDFINDVAHYASAAADQAPTILPKLETLKDIAKSPLSAADNKAIAAPIFEGTLVWTRDADGKPVKADPGSEAPAGIVFTPDELRSLFKLSDEQVGLYQEFRAAADMSLSSMAVGDIMRYGGKDLAAIRGQVLAAETLDDAAQLVDQHLETLAEANPGRAEVLRDTAARIREKVDKARDLMDRGYAPLTRYGQHSLDVVDANGERVYFGLFESRAEANKMARQMKENFPEAAVSQGTMSQEEYKLFSGVSPETVELFGDMLGLESTGDGEADQAFQSYLKLAKANRSAMKRLIHRKGIAGFSEDPGRVLAGFVYSNARQTSSSLHMGKLTEAVAAVPKGQGELKDAAVRLRDYVQNPQEEAQAFRGLLFAQYLGGSIASAMVNTTQPYAVTFPWLSQYGGIAKASKQIGRATADALKKTTGDAELDAALKDAEESGIVSPQEVFQLQAQAAGRAPLRAGDGTVAGNAMATASNALSKFSLAWGKLFGVAEQFNRRTTFIAAYRTAVEQGMADPAAFAEKAIYETQFIYSKANKPRWARGAIGGTLFCVDDSTEALTTEGWKGVDELLAGDMIASFDMSTERLVWKPVQSVHQFPFDGEMVHLTDKHHDILMTPDHRCVTYREHRVPGQRASGAMHRTLEIQDAQDLKRADAIPSGASFDHQPVGEPLDDAMVRVIGWVVTEGCFHKKNRGREEWGGHLTIAQNEGPDAATLRRDLAAAGFSWTETVHRYESGNADHVRFFVSKSQCAGLRDMLPGKQLTPPLLMRMTTAQITMLVETMIAGDGSVHKTTGRECFIQNPGATLDTFQMALTLLGKSYSVRRHGKAARAVLIRNSTVYSLNYSRRERVQYKGRVWCPIVADTHTWVARRNGKPFITHNTFKQYSVNYMELLHRMATQGGPEGKRAALLALGVLGAAVWCRWPAIRRGRR
jgi:proteasome lid subunit RPN8/RPN11